MNTFAGTTHAPEELCRFAGDQAFALACDDKIVRHTVFDLQKRLNQATEVFVGLDISNEDNVGARANHRQLRSAIPFLRDSERRKNDVVIAWTACQTEKLGFTKVRHREDDGSSFA